jgi:rhamnose transport system substrate-binding protein
MLVKERLEVPRIRGLRPGCREWTSVKRFVLWSPRDLGYLTLHVAKRLAGGGLAGGEIEAGRLGKVATKDGEVLLGPPLVFDAGNIDGFDF